jgi:hypothetical protein
MAGMNVFESDAFSMVQMTAAVEATDYKPQFLGQLGIFADMPIRTEHVAIENRDNVLALIQTTARGAPLAEAPRSTRKIRNFNTVRIAKGDTIHASEIQSIRAFGSESELMQVQAEVSNRLARLRADMELTHENMRLGAVQGIVTDADGSTIYNWFTEWGVAQPSAIAFALGTATTLVRGKCQQVIRAMRQASKGAWIDGLTQVHALASDTFFDKLIDHALVRDTYQHWAAAQDLRQSFAFSSFPYGGITFHNYRGTDDGTTLAIPADTAKFFPVNAPGVFETAWAPAESFDFVNRPGIPVYSMMIFDRDRNAWVRVEEYSYPLFYCTRPLMLQRASTN